VAIVLPLPAYNFLHRNFTESIYARPHTSNADDESLCAVRHRLARIVSPTLIVSVVSRCRDREKESLKSRFALFPGPPEKADSSSRCRRASLQVPDKTSCYSNAAMSTKFCQRGISIISIRRTGIRKRPLLGFNPNNQHS